MLITGIHRIEVALQPFLAKTMTDINLSLLVLQKRNYSYYEQGSSQQAQ